MKSNHTWLEGKGWLGNLFSTDSKTVEKEARKVVTDLENQAKDGAQVILNFTMTIFLQEF